MTDLLTTHADDQPDELGVVDERWHGNVRTPTYAQLESRSNRLARCRLPRSIEWSDEHPKTGSGKVLERRLRQPFWKGDGSNV